MPSPLTHIIGIRGIKSSFAVLAAIWAAFAFTPAVVRAKTPVNRIAVLVSLNIRPYLEALEGLKEGLQNTAAELQVFPMEDYEGKSAQMLIKDIRDNKFFLVVAVGPEAARFAGNELKGSTPHQVYTMILDPETVLPAENALCGVSLRIPAGQQIAVLDLLLPDKIRVGLLYDPANNSDFYHEAAAAANKHQLSLLPIEVSSPKDIPTVLEGAWPKIDLLWIIPDQTVSRESLVDYIIKKSLSAGVGCIGYNSFFHKSGSAISLVLDYRKIGGQTADIVATIASGKECPRVIPAYTVEINQPVVKMLDLQIQSTLDGKEGRP